MTKDLLLEKDNQDLKDDLLDILEMNNKKIFFLLNEWLGDYSYYEKPCPYKAINWGHDKDNSMEAKQSAQWFWEYERIFELINMTMDYAIASEQAIKDFKVS